MLLTAPSEDNGRQDTTRNVAAGPASSTEVRPNSISGQNHASHDMLRPDLKSVPIALPKFMGYEDRQSPREFLERYKEYCDLCGIATESCLRLLPVALYTLAKQWRHFVGGFSEWDVFAADFKAEFASVDYKAKLKDQRTQRHAENLKRPLFMQLPGITTASMTATHHPYKYWLLMVAKNPGWKF